MKKKLLVLSLFVSSACFEGIVGVEDWAHGVALCEADFSAVVVLEEATVWNDGIATYVVNAGHFQDEQTRKLVKKAPPRRRTSLQK